ncbi:serine/arginine-rich splicing factor-like protein, putative [Actinidia rufa]|uniref:Serine/arginine-rich splicing factor-like protein, putative n=1 Tax=Actinidia rufa TaxID=165716 RepID=A0A7J0EJM6_9ERIC|nr:serine/arginine-rich splicing factor-like protein, putative [Actinidia rufa]
MARSSMSSSPETEGFTLTGDSRGFAFVRYKYADEAQKAVEKLDGRVVDGREIMVQFAKYGPNAERILFTLHGFGFQSEREGTRTSIKVKRQVKKPESSTKINKVYKHLSEVEIGYSFIYKEELIGPGIGMNTRTGIPRGEVAAEVGAGMTGIDPEEGKEIIVIEAGAAVEALIIRKTVEEVNMMTRSTAGVGLMEVPPLLVVARVLGGAPLHAGCLHLGVEALTHAIAKNDHLCQKGFCLVVDQLILKAPYNALMLMNKRANECGCLAGDVAAVDAVFTLRLVDCWLYSMVFFSVSDDVLVAVEIVTLDGTDSRYLCTLIVAALVTWSCIFSMLMSDAWFGSCGAAGFDSAAVLCFVAFQYVIQRLKF